jgi:small membrane protein
MIIKLLLALGIAFIALSFLRNRNAMRFQAGKKIALAAFALLCLVSVAAPETTNWLAKQVGVGRGADLLLYLTVLGFLFVAVNTYLKFKDYDARLTRLARSVALEEAVRRREMQERRHREL